MAMAMAIGKATNPQDVSRLQILISHQLGSVPKSECKDTEHEPPEYSDQCTTHRAFLSTSLQSSI